MPRPITAVIHRQALQNNLAVVRKVMPNSKVFAVVKANAYGHGIERVYEAFKAADGFALLDLGEAKRIRALGWTGPILLLEGIFSPQDLFDCVQYQLSFTIHSEAQIEWVEKHHYVQAWERLNNLANVSKITHMMHFSDADGDRFGQQGIDYQITAFEEIVKDLPGERSVSNSAAILRYQNQLKSDYARSGIMLYGSSPDYPTHSIADWGLQPTMSLRSEIISVQHLEPNESVGYGSNFVAEQPMTIGIVACGYADGYQRISPTGTPVLVDSIRTRTIGRVSMDMLAVDLTGIENAKVGSEVVLWGQSSKGVVLPIDDVAISSGTVGYELMCAVTARVQFINQV